MINLDNLSEIKKLDPKDVLGSTDLFLEQCQQIHQALEGFSLPENFLPVPNIVFAGMGGSALGAQVISHLFKEELKVPLYINNDYNLPGFVTEDSLVILSSYSGSTEEVLSCYEEAKKKNAKIVGITTGGKLAQILKEECFPLVVLEPKNNPSGQPRLGTGYAVISTIDLLMKAEVLDLSFEDISHTINSLEAEKERIKKEAQDLAPKIYGKIPVIFAAAFLVGNAHALRNQLNETAKSFAAYSPLPELNHHLMEGLKNPPEKDLVVLMLKSNLYQDKLQKRVNLTKDVVNQNEIEVLEYQASADTPLSQALEVLMLGGYLSFYLAMLYGQDPSLIPWVDYFKEKLAH